MFDEDLSRHVGKFYGKYSGEVTANTDEQNQGRITVKVPTVLGANVEVRARPCLPFGHFFVPDVGAKVWVEFEAGSTAHPIWVGTWYANGTRPDEAAIDPPDNRVVQTPSGHTIELMDKDGDEKLVIRHKIGSFISIDKNGSILVANQDGSHLYLNADDDLLTLMEQHGNVLTMSENGVLIANSDGTAVEIKGGKVKVIATEALQVDAVDATLNSSTVTLGKDAMEPVILGQAFMTLWNLVMTHTHPTAMGPSGPPVPPILPLVPGQHLSLAVKAK